jgi:hypothetical protein
LQEKEHLKNMVEHYGRRLGKKTLPKIVQEPSELEAKASRMIPERLVFGSLTLESLPPEARARCKWAPAYYAYLNLPLFWSDGKRTLLDIVRLVEYETGRANLKDLVRYFEFLDEFGYIRLKRERKER